MSEPYYGKDLCFCLNAKKGGDTYLLSAGTEWMRDAWVRHFAAIGIYPTGTVAVCARASSLRRRPPLCPRACRLSAAGRWVSATSPRAQCGLRSGAAFRVPVCSARRARGRLHLIPRSDVGVGVGVLLHGVVVCARVGVFCKEGKAPRTLLGTGWCTASSAQPAPRTHASTRLARLTFIQQN
jgi:hypothetical protein